MYLKEKITIRFPRPEERCQRLKGPTPSNMKKNQLKTPRCKHGISEVYNTKNNKVLKLSFVCWGLRGTELSGFSSVRC